MADLKKLLGFHGYDALINHMILVTVREGAIPPAAYDQIFERLTTRPVIITGKSGDGKSTCVKELLTHWSGNVLVLDVADEYKEFKLVDFGQFFAIKWKQPDQRLRLVPSSNVMISQAEAATIFSHLNLIKSGMDLKDWVIVVEEGHRFGSDPNLRALLIEARKFVRKLILVTTDFHQYGDIARAFKPPPWQEDLLLA
jgi:hypothetical protein